MTSTGALTAYSGSKTGRSPLDKRIVKEEGSEKDVWWGPVNKAMSPEVSTSFILMLQRAHAMPTAFHLARACCSGVVHMTPRQRGEVGQTNFPALLATSCGQQETIRRRCSTEQGQSSNCIALRYRPSAPPQREMQRDENCRGLLHHSRQATLLRLTPSELSRTVTDEPLFCRSGKSTENEQSIT